MIILNKLELPTIAGAHHVLLDEDSAALMRGLADAWNARVVLTHERRVPLETDQADLRQYVERHVRLDLEHELAARSLTAIWRDGPRWYDAPRPPDVQVRIGPEADPTMHLDRVCRLRALALPTAAWDGTAWAPREPRPQERCGCSRAALLECSKRAAVDTDYELPPGCHGRPR